MNKKRIRIFVNLFDAPYQKMPLYFELLKNLKWKKKDSSIYKQKYY